MIYVKQRTEEHIIKIHLSLDQVTFYCSFCLFRCRDRATLDDHVKNVSRYKQIIAGGKCNNSSGFYEKNPLTIQPGRLLCLFAGRINQYLFQKSLTENGPQETHTDIIEQAVSDVFTCSREGLNPIDINAAMTTDSSMGGPKITAVFFLRQKSPRHPSAIYCNISSILTLNASVNFLQNIPTPTAATTSVSMDTNCQTSCQDEIDSISHVLPPVQTPDISQSYPTTPLCLTSSVDPQPVQQARKSTPATPKPTTSTLSTPKPDMLTPEPAVLILVPTQTTSKTTLSALKPVPALQPSLPVLNTTQKSLACTTLSSRQWSPTQSRKMDSTEQVLDLPINTSTRSSLSIES